jgi:hypothetical protein
MLSACIHTPAHDATGQGSGAPLSAELPPSGFAALDDADKVPFIRFFNRQAYKRWLQLPKPRAYAISEWGAAGWSWGPEKADPTWTKDVAIERALQECHKMRMGPCRIYAVDDDVVWRP